MESTFENNSKKQISEVLTKINKCWTEDHVEDLNKYFHENMKIVAPDLKILGNNREACIKSYADFIKQASIKNYSESEPKIFIWENTAIASYEYDIEWEMDNKIHKETGKDLFLFSYINGEWKSVWRKLIPKDKK